MNQKAVEKAPVESVGGTQSTGPWPEGVDEIAKGEAYQRPVRFSDGEVREVEVTVTDLRNIVREDGTETDGYIVAFETGGNG